MIEVQDLAVDIDDTRILSDVSISVAPGEVVGVIGPNGAGKTTLLRAIDGVIAPVAGSITIAGNPLSTLSTRELARRVAVLRQETAVSFGFSVREIVAMGRTPYRDRLGRGDSRERDLVDAALDRTDVRHLSERPITDVSGGERQRVMLARAIAQETPIVLLDEPTASLDINYQIETFELVDSLAGEGKAVLAAIHDLDLAARYCDRLLLLAGGNQVACGDPADVLRDEIVSEAYGTRTAVRRDPLTGAVSVTALPPRKQPSGPRVHVIGAGTDCERLLRRFYEAGFELSVGVLRENGRCLEVARALDLPAVTLPAQATATEATREAHRQLLEEAAVTVVLPFRLGAETEHLLSAAEIADPAVVVPDGRPPAAAETPVLRERWERLVERWPAVSFTEVTAAVASQVPSENIEDGRAPDATDRGI